MVPGADDSGSDGAEDGDDLEISSTGATIGRTALIVAALLVVTGAWCSDDGEHSN